MNDVELVLACERCRHVIPPGQRAYTVRVDGGPPGEDPVRLQICGACLESMSRWVLRRGHGHGHGHGRGRRDNSLYTAPLDRGLISSYRKTALALAALVLPALLLTAYIVTTLGSRP